MSIDRRLFQLLHYRAGAWPVVDGLLLGCARFGSYAAVLLMGVMALVGGRAGRRSARRCLAAIGALYAVVELLGRLARRARPFVEQPGARPLIDHRPDRSFPSRHVASAVAMAVVTRPASAPIARAMALLAVGLGLGRVRAGLHYPSDVLAGTLLGYAAGRLLRANGE